ncbi:hypothetical protein ACWY2R_07485 [Enterococcus avium]
MTDKELKEMNDLEIPFFQVDNPQNVFFNQPFYWYSSHINWSFFTQEIRTKTQINNWLVICRYRTYSMFYENNRMDKLTLIFANYFSNLGYKYLKRVSNKT